MRKLIFILLLAANLNADSVPICLKKFDGSVEFNYSYAPEVLCELYIYEQEQKSIYIKETEKKIARLKRRVKFLERARK